MASTAHPPPAVCLVPRAQCLLLTARCYVRINTIIGAWLSLVERTVRDREVGGSNPLAPTISRKQRLLRQPFLFSKSHARNGCREIAVCFDPSRRNSLLNTTTSETENIWGMNLRC